MRTRSGFGPSTIVIRRLNRVLRGTANYFATPFLHNRRLFTEIDKWIRVRLRSMKFKRKWKTPKGKTNHLRFRLKHFRRMGLLSLYDVYPQLAYIKTDNSP